MKYIWHVGCGEARILLSQRSVEEMMADPALPLSSRQRLELIHRTAQESVTILKLKRTHQYRNYADLKTTFTVWVLTMAEPDQLKLITFRFPLVGEFPYLGFFQREKVELIAGEYSHADRFLRQAAAFSTLGYLPDPILPNFLTMEPGELIRTVVHELVHATVFRIGDAPWSESVAMSLGDAGAALLMERWGMEGELKKLLIKREDEQRFARLLEETIKDLEEYYAHEPERSRRLDYKKERIAKFQEALRATPWQVLNYQRYADMPINHAFLLAHRVYAGDPEVQEQWFRVARKDYLHAIRIFKERARSGTELWAPLPSP